ncbi:hypothetical protein GIB67_020612 [Kingdonia uniflora]|uniref:MTTase N-terminal domain-containing protein n=1 Tax=Kingdonia uniflora TaxID=39325 RepID=A0A7J7M922_9MAGN|nr:hypothetical protein GIB67_020612 [Kingdonia uniflora]
MEPVNIEDGIDEHISLQVIDFSNLEDCVNKNDETLFFYILVLAIQYYGTAATILAEMCWEYVARFVIEGRSNQNNGGLSYAGKIEDMLVSGGVLQVFRLPLMSIGLNPKRLKNKKNLKRDNHLIATPSSDIPKTQTIYMKAFGCSHNPGDREYMVGQLSAFGYALSDNPEEADLWLINTCTVYSPSQSDIEKMVSVKGMIIRCSSLIPEIRVGVIQCLVCAYFSDPIIVDREDQMVEEQGLAGGSGPSKNRGDFAWLSLDVSSYLCDLNFECLRVANVAFREIDFEEKMHTRRASRLRLIDKEVKNENNVSGHAQMDEGSNVEELVIAKDIPLAVVILEAGGSSSRYRKEVATEDSGEEEMEGGQKKKGKGQAEPSGGERGEGEQSDRSEDSTESDKANGYIFQLKPPEGIMAYRGQIRLEMRLPLRRLVKEMLNFWEVTQVQMNGNLYEMMKRKRQKKTDSLLRSIPITSKPSKKRGGKGVLKFVEGIEEENLARKAERGKGKVVPNSPRVLQTKVTQCRRCRALGDDDAEDVGKDMTEAEREEQALAMAASMVELCGDDPDESSRQMKWSMYQGDAWAQSFNMAVKVLMRKIQEAVDSLELARGTEASVVSENKTLK